MGLRQLPAEKWAFIGVYWITEVLASTFVLVMYWYLSFAGLHEASLAATLRTFKYRMFKR
jgi:hypothetical protein